jgi:hypothetical protein
MFKKKIIDKDKLQIVVRRDAPSGPFSRGTDDDVIRKKK